MQVGVPLAVLSGVQFGISTPLAKLLVGDVGAWTMAGLLMAVGLWLLLTERHEH